MPAPPSHTKSWSMTMIAIGILSAIIIISFVTFFFHLQRRRQARPSNNMSDPEARRLSQITGESERSNSQAETNSDRTQIGFNIVGRLPRLENNNIPIRSVHPSVHNASPAPSNFEPPLPPTVVRRRSDPEQQTSHQVVRERQRTHFFDKDRQRRKHFPGQSLDSRIDQNPPLEPPTIIELPRSSSETIEQLDKDSYSPYNEQGSSMRSLLEMFPNKGDPFPPSAHPPIDFNPASTKSPDGIDRSADFRIAPSAIVETTEKKPPVRILRKKILNLISTQSRPDLRNESEDKYYWEMMQVETNQTWWQLPFPPRLSPIAPEFGLTDLDFHPQLNSTSHS